MKIPESVKVLGKEYRVVVGRHDLEMAKEGQWGKCDYSAGEIRIRGDLPHDQQEETLLHELIHTCENAVISDRVPEPHVYGISAALYAIFKDNGWWPE